MLTKLPVPVYEVTTINNNFILPIYYDVLILEMTYRCNWKMFFHILDISIVLYTAFLVRDPL